MYSIRRFDINNRTAIEPLGTKPKSWFLQTLFKVEERDTGEDWAEKIACHLCEILGIPHVHYELAELYDGNTYINRGVVCDNFATQPPHLVLGNQLLLKSDPDYPEKTRYRVREHTVDAVCEVLKQLVRPNDCWMINTPGGIKTALDVFVGYVMLDAWTANQDRHHENWGALQDEIKQLAPTFDHGAALGRNLSDEERSERLNTKDRNRTINYFSQRAKSAFYNQKTDTRPLGTFDAFWKFASHAPQAAQDWLKRLAIIERNAIEGIIDEVPDNRMTGIAKRFTLELLVVNGLVD